MGGNTKILYTTSSGLTFISTLSNNISEDFKLHQNYPNPFNPETKIKFDISKFSHVQVKVFDILGKEISILVNENLGIGQYESKFNGADLSSGIYLYSLYINGFLNETKKLHLLK